MGNVKFLIVFLFAVLFVALFSAVTWSIPVTSLYNRHNMSSNALHDGPKALAPGAGGTDRICVFCHTPHSATPESALWGRPEPTTESFDLYAGRLAIKDAAISDKSQYNSTSFTYPNGASRMCMSCHDGATAIGTVLSQAAEIGMEPGQRLITGSAIVDLAVSHPISFVWNADVASDVDAWHLSQVPVTGSRYQTPINYNIAYLDSNSRMQCTTCHDPHVDPSRNASGIPNTEDADPNNDFPPFWRHYKNCFGGDTDDNCYEEVCSQCHFGTPPVISFLPPTTLHNSVPILP